MKTLLLIIGLLLCISILAQNDSVYIDTTYTLLKPNLMLVEIVEDSTTTNDFLFKKKETNAELKRLNQTLTALRERKKFLLKINEKINE